MLGIHTILHPTDFSPSSEYACHLATALARDYGAHLVLVHVVPVPVAVYGYGEGIVPPTMEVHDELQQKLDNVSMPEGLWVSRRLEEGDPVAEILEVARETNADLIVMGTHGRRGLSRLLMGSVAEQVMRRAACPVLTVRTPFPASEQAAVSETRTAQMAQDSP